MNTDEENFICIHLCVFFNKISIFTAVAQMIITKGRKQKTEGRSHTKSGLTITFLRKLGEKNHLH